MRGRRNTCGGSGSSLHRRRARRRRCSRYAQGGFEVGARWRSASSLSLLLIRRDIGLVRGGAMSGILHFVIEYLTRQPGRRVAKPAGTADCCGLSARFGVGWDWVAYGGEGKGRSSGE